MPLSCPNSSTHNKNRAGTKYISRIVLKHVYLRNIREKKLHLYTIIIIIIMKKKKYMNILCAGITRKTWVINHFISTQ